MERYDKLYTGIPLFKEEAVSNNTSTVYRSTIESLTNNKMLDVAIKYPKDDHDDVIERETNFITSEIFDHPNIIKFYASWILNSKPIIIMELMEYTLAQALADKKSLSSQQHLVIAYGLTRGLQYLHGRNIVHRDINPKNVSIDKNVEQVKIYDFKFAVNVSVEPSKIHWKEGTPAWLSPEIAIQLHSETRKTPPDPFKIDIWALGQLLLQLYINTNGTPYSKMLDNAGVGIGHTLSVLATFIANGRHDDIPAQQPLSQIITQCLKRSPDERPTATEIIEALDRITDPNLPKITPAYLRQLAFKKRIATSQKTTIREYWSELDKRSIIIKSFTREAKISEINCEINIMKQLTHPNIIMYYGTGTIDSLPCILMEPMGPSLEKVLSDNNILNDEKNSSASAKHLNIALSLGNGLKYLHNINIVHYDIKSANILTAQDCDIIKICDFDLSIDLKNNNSDTRWVRGTPIWYPPETAIAGLTGQKHAPNHPFKIDIWGVGQILLLLYMNGKKTPHYDKYHYTLLQLIKLISTGETNTIPPNKPLTELITWCLNKNPAQRPHATQIIGTVKKLKAVAAIPVAPAAAPAVLVDAVAEISEAVEELKISPRKK